MQRQKNDFISLSCIYRDRVNETSSTELFCFTTRMMWQNDCHQKKEHKGKCRGGGGGRGKTKKRRKQIKLNYLKINK